MSGILDNKTRIMDAIITLAGRRQMASGRLRVEFASFTDGGTFYQADVVSGSDDATNRIFFEATSRPQDTITFETDDSGNLIPINTDSDLSIIDGDIFSKSTGSSDYGSYIFASGSGDFASLSAGIITGSVDNFKNLYMLGTRSPTEIDKNLRLSNTTLSYTIDEDAPFPDATGVEINIDAVEPLFVDKRLSHIDNFKFLPPVFPPVPGFDEGGQLGDYVNLNESDELTYDQLMAEIKRKESFTIDFDSTSSENNIVMQMFETGNGKFLKLDVIDFGEFSTDETSRANKRVFFIGKVFLDSVKMPTFVNLFTMVID
jgi:hypothetical protein